MQTQTPPPDPPDVQNDSQGQSTNGGTVYISQERIFRRWAILQRKDIPKRDIERLRSNLEDSSYWECEYDLYLTLLLNTIYDKDEEKDGYRKARDCYNRLREEGLTPAQIEAERLNISDNTYWQREGEHFGAINREREREMEKVITARLPEEKHETKPKPKARKKIPPVRRRSPRVAAQAKRRRRT